MTTPLLDLSKAHWYVDFATDQIIRSANHDSFFGHDRNLPQWNTEIFFRYIHPHDSEKFSQAMKNAMASSKSFDHTYRVVWPDDSVHRLRSWGFIENDPISGAPLRLIGFTEKAPEQEVSAKAPSRLF